MADTASVQPVDGNEFIRALQRSRKSMLVPQNYKAMRLDCGGIVQYSLFTGTVKLGRVRLPAGGEMATGPA